MHRVLLLAATLLMAALLPPAALAAPARCVVRGPDVGTPFDGPCQFRQSDGNGSFSLLPVGSATIAGRRMITVTILEPGVAEVAGLTEFGISSRWGRATRTAPDSACWRGTGFEICAYGL